MSARNTSRMHQESLARAERLEGFASRDPSNAALLLDLAATYHQGGVHDRALATLDRLSEADAAKGVALRAQMLMALARWDEAVALFDAALPAEPDNAALHFNLGYALLGAQRPPARAVEALSRAAQLEPTSAHIARWLAVALDAAGDHAAAKTTAQRAIDLAPDDGEALLTLARFRLDEGDAAGALQAALRCTIQHPAHADGWALKGQVELMLLDAAAASKSLRRALDLDADDNDARLALAQASMMSGRVRQARRLLDEAIAIDADDDTAWCLRGWACAAEDDLTDAHTNFDRALQLDPQSADAWAAMAGVHLAAQERDAAGAAVQRALELSPEHSLALMVQAELYKTDGEIGKAQDISAKLLSASPFGAAGPTLGAVVQQAAASPSMRRLQRRFAHKAKPRA